MDDKMSLVHMLLQFYAISRYICLFEVEAIANMSQEFCAAPMQFGRGRGRAVGAAEGHYSQAQVVLKIWPH